MKKVESHNIFYRVKQNALYFLYILLLLSRSFLNVFFLYILFIFRTMVKIVKYISFIFLTYRGLNAEKTESSKYCIE